MERFKDTETQNKIAKVFKAVIAAGIVAPLSLTAVGCVKKEVAAVSETQQQTIPATPEITIPETTKAPETTTPTTEVVETGPVEYEGMIINPIEGLKFDKGTFFALEGNPYGLEAKTKAGIFIKDAFEFNRQMENSIGLRPEVIEVLQQKYLEENQELKIPVFIDLEKNKDVKINLLTHEVNNEDLRKLSPKDFTSLAIDVPDGTIIYAPLKTDYTEQFSGVAIIDWKDEKYPNHYDVSFTIPEEIRNKIIFDNSQRIVYGLLVMVVKNVELLVSDEIKDKNGWIRSSSEVGTPFFKINKDSGKNDLPIPIDVHLMFEDVAYNSNTERNELSFYLSTAENILLEVNKTKVFILPANDK